MRMFESFEAFTKGWARLLRLGMGNSNIQSVVELLLVLQLFVGPKSPASAMLALAGVAFLLYLQRHFGEFSPWGAVFYPLSIALFTGLSAIAVVARVTGQPVVWRSREYRPGEHRSRCA